VPFIFLPTLTGNLFFLLRSAIITNIKHIFIHYMHKRKYTRNHKTKSYCVKDGNFDST